VYITFAPLRAGPHSPSKPKSCCVTTRTKSRCELIESGSKRGGSHEERRAAFRRRQSPQHADGCLVEFSAPGSVEAGRFHFRDTLPTVQVSACLARSRHWRARSTKSALMAGSSTCAALRSHSSAFRRYSSATRTGHPLGRRCASHYQCICVSWRSNGEALTCSAQSVTRLEALAAQRVPSRARPQGNSTPFSGEIPMACDTCKLHDRR
jgi:hypothetical protein